MDNNDMMQLMMQMMQNQNQLLTMMMQQQIQNPSQQTVAAAPIQSIEVNSSSNSEMQQQINTMRAEIEQLKNQLAEAQQIAKQKTQETASLKLELSGLKNTIGKAEAYLGQTIEEVAETAENLSGDDYYEEKKAEWDEKGLTNQEKHEKIKEFRHSFVQEKEDDIFGEMIQF